MRKNRIWRKGICAGMCTMLLAGVIGGSMSLPVKAGESAEKGNLTITQEASWSDWESRRGTVTMTIRGANCPEENPQTEESIALCDRRITFVMYLSEYFLLDNPYELLPEGFLTDEIPVCNQEGRDITISRISCKLPEYVGNSDTWQVTIPVVLRQEYRFLPDFAVYPVSQDAPLKKSWDEGREICSSGTFLQEKSEEGIKILAQAPSAMLKTEAAQVDFSLSMQAQEETAKAGQRLTYSVFVTNTGEIPLTDIHLKAEFVTENSDGADIPGEWEPDSKLFIQDEEAVLTRLSEGETKEVCFSAKLSEGQSGALIPKVTAAVQYPGSRGSMNGENLVHEASLPVVAQPLTAAFTVNKTADCKEARPGDTITYQISIHNTGERTLHSVISTERFLHSNIRAQFEEKEGVELNSTKTQARIPQIAPGDCVKLKAFVTLPEDLIDEKLVNQVIVVTDETGESEPIRSQAEVKVHADKSMASATGKNKAEIQNSSRDSAPKTGDSSGRELFEILIMVSVLVSVISAGRMLLRKKEKSKD